MGSKFKHLFPVQESHLPIFMIRKRKLYCVSISVKHLCANSRLAQMLDLCITCPSNWWDGESCSKAAVLEWQRSEYKYWGPVASGPPQPLFPITSQRGGKVQRILIGKLTDQEIKSHQRRVLQLCYWSVVYALGSSAMNEHAKETYVDSNLNLRSRIKPKMKEGEE